jgi:hypothetical protein
MREVAVQSDLVLVHTDAIETPWNQLADRLSEAACARMLIAIEHQGHKCSYDLDQLWRWENPLAVLNKAQGAP